METFGGCWKIILANSNNSPVIVKFIEGIWLCNKVQFPYGLCLTCKIFQEYSRYYFISQLLLKGRIFNGIFHYMQQIVMFLFHFDGIFKEYFAGKLHPTENFLVSLWHDIDPQDEKQTSLIYHLLYFRHKACGRRVRKHPVLDQQLPKRLTKMRVRSKQPWHASS